MQISDSVNRADSECDTCWFCLGGCLGYKVTSLHKTSTQIRQQGKGSPVVFLAWLVRFQIRPKRWVDTTRL